MKGHIARRYGDLVEDLWSGSSRSLAPLKLRVSAQLQAVATKRGIILSVMLMDSFCFNVTVDNWPVCSKI